MVRDDVGTEPIENAIVKIRGAALESAVAGSPLAYGEYDLGAASKMADHFRND